MSKVFYNPDKKVEIKNIAEPFKNYQVVRCLVDVLSKDFPA